MKKYPVFIGGSPRSGTTALLQLINTSPCAFISSEENLLEDIADIKGIVSTKEKRSKVLLNNGMRDRSIRETISEENIHSHNFTKDSLWPIIRYIYKWHHKEIHKNSDLILWGDKLPNYYKNIEEIISLKKIKYLHITRNPLDVINSMLRRTEKAKEGKDWWKAITNFDEMLEVWCHAYKSIRAFDGYENILHIYYEDLLFDYENVIQKMNVFFDTDLEYENILLSEPNLHFDRKYLTQESVEKILNADQVIQYLEIRNNCRSNKRT